MSFAYSNLRIKVVLIFTEKIIFEVPDKIKFRRISVKKGGQGLF